MRRIEMVEEGQSRGRVREIYREIERAFGVPFVGGIFRALAARPAMLEQAWSSVRPNIATQAFVAIASELRQRSETFAETTFELVDLYAWMRDHSLAREDVRRILYILEVFHSLDPKLVLATAAVLTSMLGIRDPRIKPLRASPPIFQEPEFPTGVPQVMLDQAPDAVKEDYLDIREILGVPVVPDEFQALGNWPGFLRRVWGLLKPVMRSTTYLDEARSLSELATLTAQELPYPVQIENPAPESLQVVEVFLSLYSRLSISVSAIRWMLIEGERFARAVLES